MRLDDLPEQFAAFADRARDVLDWEVKKARKAAEALNAERAAVQKELSELQEQYKSTKKQLDDVLSNLNKGTTLAGLNAEISEAKKALEKLKADTAKATAAFEAADKQRQDAERELTTANEGMQRIRQERIEAASDIDNIRKLLKSVDLRRSA
jgi:chromosome segregation ATPase